MIWFEGRASLTIAFFLWVSLLSPWLAQADTHTPTRRNVVIEWDSIPGATSYEIRVQRKNSHAGKYLTFKTKNPKWTADLKPGTYSMETRSLDSRGVPGDWSPPAELEVKLPPVTTLSPAQKAVFKSGEENDIKMSLSWKPVESAVSYRVQIHSTSGDWKKEIQTDNPQVEVSVPVAQSIEWNVRAIDINGTDGETSDTASAFETQGPALAKPNIAPPFTEFIREVHWDAPSHASSYNYELRYLNRQKRKWEIIKKSSDFRETSLPLNISDPSGTYRLLVQAKNEHRPPSPVAKLDFKKRGGFKDLAELESAIRRDSVTKPTSYYAIASYMATGIQYSAVNHDANAITSFTSVGGTGRLGLGYQPVESKWGGYGTVDLSGFNIARKNFHFASAEGHVTHSLELGQTGLVRVGIGLFYKQLPVVLGSPVDGISGLGKVNQTGPHAGFIYWFPITERFGLQLNSRAYYSFFGSTSMGPKANASFSYQYGLLGSYRFEKNWIGYAGYAYRHDEASYQSNPSDPNSFAKPGDMNGVQIDGHYVNLILEYSF